MVQIFKYIYFNRFNVRKNTQSRAEFFLPSKLKLPKVRRANTMLGTSDSAVDVEAFTFDEVEDEGK